MVSVLDCDFYNFDETGFMMGILCAGMVVTHADQQETTSSTSLWNVWNDWS